MKFQNLKRSFGLATMSGLLMLGVAQQASAVTPANSTITNTVSLSYTGLATPLTASVGVKVSLVAAAPTLSAPADNTVAEGQASAATYTVVATSNGPDTYNLSAVTTLTNLTGTTNPATFSNGGGAITSVVLGATAANTAATTGANTITVPADGTADSNVNGIAVGDTIVIGANTYTVASVVDNAAGDSTITITATLAANVAVGALIAEQQSFDMNLATAGALTAKGVAANASTASTLASATTPAQTVTDTHVTNVVEVTFVKLVRNVSNANGAGGTLINGQTYFPTASNVSAVSTDVLEYAIQVTAPAGVAIAGASVTDAVPVFTTYVANSTRLNAITVAGDGATSPLVAGLAVDDDGLRGAGAAATGAIAAGATVTVILQVTVD